MKPALITVSVLVSALTIMVITVLATITRTPDTTTRAQTSITPTPTVWSVVTLFPSLTPTNTPSPLPTPTLTLTPVPTLTQSPTPQALVQEPILNQVNEYRAKQGLNRLETRGDLCQFAIERAREATTNFSHDGFHERFNSGTFQALNYQRIGENLWTGSAPTAQEIVTDWNNSAPHKENLQQDWQWGCAGVNGSVVVFLFLK